MHKVVTTAFAAVLSMFSITASMSTIAQDEPPAGEKGAAKPVSQETYSSDEILAKGRDFFGATTEGLAKAIEKVFADQGQPNAYILGEEGGGAFIAGLRYGKGTLYYKGSEGSAGLPIFWQGPSVGWDFGGNASKSFTLVYNLRNTDQMLQRFPGVDGSIYVVGGLGVNYQRSGDITLAPIRTGVGLRAGANVGYLHYTLKRSLIPF
ncbi:DUF1134 domain-containing protein [Hydrocarboniphaga effusa]|jgi:hypothetical protein|uniref:DUF1134 domain-containing protein n=1 Tax=Hydrocarboniphaga effusa TaxID=243629 RepID=UPI0031381720